MKQSGRIQYFPLSVEVFWQLFCFGVFFLFFFLLTATLAVTIPVLFWFNKTLYLSVPAEYSAVLGLAHDNQHRVPYVDKNGF